MLGVSDTPDLALGNQPADQQCFTYDWARRLTGAWTPASGDCAAAPVVGSLGGAEPYWKSYAYDDETGNRTSTVLHRATADGGDVTSGYAYPEHGVDRPHSVSTVTATGAGGTGLGESTYTWDAAGNLTGRALAGKPAQELAWDVEGELASVAEDSDGDGTVEDAERAEQDGYVYSADGDRLLRTQGGRTTLYLPGQEITLDDATGAVSALRYYAFAGKTVAVRTASRYSDVTTIFSDHHGTGTIQVGNTTNQVTRRYTDPFGAPRDEAVGVDPELDPAGGEPAHEVGGPADWVGDHGFLDKPQDATGLTAVGARMYDPALGSFVSVDPVMDLSDPQQWNAYAYSNNNPMTWADPSGMLPIGAGHVGYNPKTQPKGGDPCAKATSCIKTKGGRGSPVRVRECYTAYACGYYSTHADGYETSGGGSVRLVQRTSSRFSGVGLIRTGAAAAAHNRQVAAEKAAAKARESATNSRKQKNGWLQGATEWAKYTFGTAEGVEGWTGVGADWTGYASLALLGLQGASLFLAAATSWTGIGGVSFGALAGGFASGATVLGWASTGLSYANGIANARLGRKREAGRSLMAGTVGLVTGGLGAGASRISLKIGMQESPYLSDLMLGVGGWISGEVVGGQE